MATKKVATIPQDVEENITPAQETVEADVQETPAQEEVKVYQFKSENPYLTVTHLGIQFRAGKASTTNLEIARALAKTGGVELVED